MAKRTKKPSERAPNVIDSTLALAAERGWRRVGLADIAAEAKLPLSQLYGRYSSRTAILAAFVRQIDEAVLKEGAADGETPRDRLFDVLMRRFEALRPYKLGVEAILGAAGSDPLAALCGAPRLVRSMAWMLEAAGIDSHGLAGRLRAKGLVVVYLAAMRSWLADDSADLSRTMAALDKHLRRAETLAGLCRPFAGRGGGGGSEAPAPAS
ncbi:MAG: TetR family transcriptional regulator [Alphaproteobacteria bacterium]